MASTRPLTVLDLFAGAGGLTAGLHAGSDRFRTIRAIEWDKAAAASYAATFGDIVYSGSIQDWLATEIVPEVDIIVGGPPCQGFSSLGKQEVLDERNFLWRQYAETILRAQPKYFVVENVAEFARSQQFEEFKAATAQGGRLSNYRFDHWVLNAADYGAPQARKRAVLIGHHRDLPAPGRPEATHAGNHRTVRDVLGGIPELPDRDHVFDAERHTFDGVTYPGVFGPRDLHWSRRYTDLSLKRFAEIPVGGNRFDLPDELKAACWIRHRSGSGDVMGRMHWDRPSVTIRTEFFKPEKGRYLHPVAPRAITHYEAAILQGFPETHRFVGSRTSIARQIGNAVPIPLGAAIGRHLAETAA